MVVPESADCSPIHSTTPLTRTRTERAQTSAQFEDSSNIRSSAKPVEPDAAEADASGQALGQNLSVDIEPSDIIEQVIDELAMGELGQSIDGFKFSRIGPGELLLDYGAAGLFVLEIRPAK